MYISHNIDNTTYKIQSFKQACGKSLYQYAYKMDSLHKYKQIRDIECAKEFANKKFGIKDLCTNDIEIVNYLLEAFSRLATIIDEPLGITKIFVKEELKRKKSKDELGGIMYYEEGRMILSKFYIEREREFLVDNINKIVFHKKTKAENALTMAKTSIKLHDKKIKLCEMPKIINSFNIKSFSITDLPNKSLFHEIWHRLHYLNCKKNNIDFYKMGKKEELVENGINDESIIEEFLSPKIQKIISRYNYIGSYAKSSPCEFVAEVGSIIANGIKPPKYIMKLYYKYGGPLIKII